MKQIKCILFDWGGTLGKSGDRQLFIKGSKRQKYNAIKHDTIQTLEYLLNKGYILGIVSNTSIKPSVMNKALYDSGLIDYFTCITYSNEHNQCPKPCPKIYNDTINCLRKKYDVTIKPKNILYVGNHYQKDVIGANNIGMKTAYIINQKHHMPPNAKTHDIAIHNLYELSKYL